MTKKEMCLDNYMDNLYNNILQNSKFEKDILDFLDKEVNFDDWLKELYLLEQKIGAVGIHNVNRTHLIQGEHTGVTGTYEGDRSIFRALQYCAVQMLHNFIIIDTRYVAYMSGIHIEGIIHMIAQKINVHDNLDVPMGTVIHKYLLNSDFFKDKYDAQLLSDALLANKIYVEAKHNYCSDEDDEEGMRIDRHLFSYRNTVLFYFCCRILGIKLMKYMEKHNIAPKSFTNPPVITYLEFLEVANHLSWNLRRWHPDIVAAGRE